MEGKDKGGAQEMEVSKNSSPFEEHHLQYSKSLDDHVKSGGSEGVKKVTFGIESKKQVSLEEGDVQESSNSASTKIRKTRDIIWQENPDRILKYKANHLHYYGWIPLLMIKNVKATVFSDVYIHFQTFALVSWAALLQLTGLGIAERDMRTFIRLFGTPWAGSILNLGMVMVFILGLFISLVINRWSAIRQAYGQLRGTTLDVCMILSNTIYSQKPSEEASTAHARTELVRLLNLGHLLVVSRADKENTSFQKARGVKTYSKRAARGIRKFMIDLGFSTAVVREVEDRWERVWRNPRDLTYTDLLAEGLVNPDEWKLLQASERDGLPSYQTVYYWVQALMHKCRAADWVLSAPQTLPMILTKVNSIAASGSNIMSAINSQMPYPYVHLVSFVAHAYLIVLSSWLGCFLRIGYPDAKHFAFNSSLKPESLTTSGNEIYKNPWTVTWVYILLCMANLMFQGLLNMHTLLDNPFGRHCSKFPLRAQVSQVMNATRAMLTCSSQLPEAVSEVFQLNPKESKELKMNRLSSKGSTYADFVNPPSRMSSGFSPSMGATSSLRRSLKESSIPERASKRMTRGASMDTLQEVVDGSHLESSDVVADEGMVRPAEPPSAPKTTKCVSRGLSIHNEVIFGNLPDRQGSMNGNVSGDATLQELFLQVSMADAMQHSIDALTSSMEGNGNAPPSGSLPGTAPQSPRFSKQS